MNPDPKNFFIHGHSTKLASDGMPMHLHVCPAYGADWSVIYVHRGCLANEAKPAAEPELPSIRSTQGEDNREPMILGLCRENRSCMHAVCICEADPTEL